MNTYPFILQPLDHMIKPECWLFGTWCSALK